MYTVIAAAARLTYCLCVCLCVCVRVQHFLWVIFREQHFMALIKLPWQRRQHLNQPLLLPLTSQLPLAATTGENLSQLRRRVKRALRDSTSERETDRARERVPDFSWEILLRQVSLRALCGMSAATKTAPGR